MTDLQKELFLLSDASYRDFHAKLMPTVEKEKIIGIRAPVLKKFSKDFAKRETAKEFLLQLPHKYYEENNLHGLLIMRIKDFDLCISETERFLPFIDNWATCDMLKSEILKTKPDVFLKRIKKWLKSEHTYTVRYGMKCLMDFYLENNFSKEILFLVSDVSHEDYYVKMVQAWFFATALAKQYDCTIKVLEEKKLPIWVHNKTIQKAIESYRIDDDIKAYLKSLKIKER